MFLLMSEFISPVRFLLVGMVQMPIPEILCSDFGQDILTEVIHGLQYSLQETRGEATIRSYCHMGNVVFWDVSVSSQRASVASYC
jgi:hypothetical protein